MTSLAASFHLALRGLRRRPGFAAVSIATIALAIGANTAVFSVVNGTLLRPLPFRAPDRLVSLDVRAHTGFMISLSVPNYRDWRDRNRAFSALAASTSWGFKLTGRGPAQIVTARAVLGDFFGTLGLPIEIGRLISTAEAPDHGGGPAVAVVSHQFWQRGLGGDRGVLGQALTLDGRDYVVVGILPPNAGFPAPDIDAYVPMASIPDLPWEDRNSGFGARAFARLRPGATLADARADMARVDREIRDGVGASASQAVLTSLSGFYVGDVRSQLWTLMGAVGFVLLIAIANVGNLLLARGEDRHRELAVRSALGAGRGVLVRLLLLEALVLAGIGGILGAALAFGTVQVILPLLPTDIPALLRSRIHVDGGVLLFGIALALGTGLVFGLVPALRATRINLAGAFAAGARTTDARRGGLRSALVVAEVALALVLLVSAGLMLKSLGRLLHVDKGFDETGVLTAAVSASDARVPDAQRWRQFYGQLRDRVAALPGVKSAAFALLLPLSDRSWELRIHPEGVPVSRETGRSVLYNIVTPEYFTTLGVPIIRGRGFTAGDREGGPPVAVIDETMASQFWAGGNPLGKRVTFEEVTDGGQPVYRTVVGVVKNVRHYELMAPSRIQVYVPMDQSGRRWGNSLRLLLKTDGPTDRLGQALQSLVGETDRDAMLWQVRPLAALVDQATARNRAMARVLAVFGAGALGLAALGIFGVMSCVVSRRTREIGIRMALGADTTKVLRWALGRALRLTGLGLVVGVGGAAALTRVLGKALFDVSPLDAATYAWVSALLAAAAVLAAWLPARRAVGVDPAGVMREEG